jgi:hypothetical protein
VEVAAFVAGGVQVLQAEADGGEAGVGAVGLAVVREVGGAPLDLEVRDEDRREGIIIGGRHQLQQVELAVCPEDGFHLGADELDVVEAVAVGEERAAGEIQIDAFQGDHRVVCGDCDVADLDPESEGIDLHLAHREFEAEVFARPVLRFGLDEAWGPQSAGGRVERDQQGEASEEPEPEAACARSGCVGFRDCRVRHCRRLFVHRPPVLPGSE